MKYGRREERVEEKEKKEAHVKLRPVDFATDVVFVCDLAHAPKPIDETIAQAQAAAARAVTILGSKGMAVGGVVAEITPKKGKKDIHSFD